jgi:hypothetical protein
MATQSEIGKPNVNLESPIDAKDLKRGYFSY